MDLNEFSNVMQDIAKDVDRNASRIVRKVALAVDATVVLATPVDTGRARANWQVGLDQPVTGWEEKYSPSGRESIDAARQQIDRYTSQNTSLNITNNLPYIGKLNDGYSAQAPSGFVEQAVMIGVDALKDASIISKG